MIIGITGATGQLGRLAIAALRERAPQATLVALVRDPAKAADLGIEARAADYTRPDTLATAFAGIQTLVLISSNNFTDRAAQHFNAIDAAKAAGVDRIVYTSILNATASPVALASDHKLTEIALAGSGLQYTVLRNGWYTENFTGSLAGALEHGAMAGSTADGRVSLAARRDYAEAIAVTAMDATKGNRIHELAGDVGVTKAELAAEVARQTGKSFGYHDLPVEQFAGMLAGLGLPPAFATMLADADAGVAAGALFDESGTLSGLIGRPTTPMADTVREALA